MSFSAEEIARFDEILAGMFRQELTQTILIEIGALVVLAILFVMSRSKDMECSRWSFVSAITEDDQTRYRNGKKLTRQEREAQRNTQKARVRQGNKAWLAVIGVLLFCMGVALGITSAVRLARMQRDMDQDAYVVHEGEFEYEFSFGGRNSGDRAEITFTNANGETVTVPVYDPAYGDMENGLYTGRVVYAKNCGYLIEMETTPIS